MNTDFKADSCTTDEERNDRLAELLRVHWNDRPILTIHRLPHPDHPKFANHGWLATFR